MQSIRRAATTDAAAVLELPARSAAAPQSASGRGAAAVCVNGERAAYSAFYFTLFRHFPSQGTHLYFPNSCSFARGCAPPRARRGGSPFRYAAQIDRIAAHRVRHCANKKRAAKQRRRTLQTNSPQAGPLLCAHCKRVPGEGGRGRFCRLSSASVSGDPATRRARGGRRTPPTMQAVGTDLTTICPRCPGWGVRSHGLIYTWVSAASRPSGFVCAGIP